MDATIVWEETLAGDPFAHAGREKLHSREQQALRLYSEHGHRIEQAGVTLYWCPSQDGERYYQVRYPVEEGALESCECLDWEHRGRYNGQPCVHILAVAIRHAKVYARRRRNFIAAFAGVS